MNFRPMLITNTLLIAGMAAASAWAWSTIPDGASIPVHFGIDGAPDRFAGKTEALLFTPAIAAFVAGLMWLLPRLDPRRPNIEASAKFWNATAILSVALLAYAHGLILLFATGYKFDILNALVPAMSVMFAGLGNYLAKTRPNFFGGIRTPWTLSSDYAWEKSHRLGGRGFVLGGIASIATWLAFDAKAALFVLVGSVIAASVAAAVASYFYWRADPERSARDAGSQPQS